METKGNAKAKREVSYYGPVFIKNNRMILPEETNKVSDVDKLEETSFRPTDEFDVSKYKLYKRPEMELHKAHNEQTTTKVPLSTSPLPQITIEKDTRKALCSEQDHANIETIKEQLSKTDLTDMNQVTKDREVRTGSKSIDNLQMDTKEMFSDLDNTLNEVQYNVINDLTFKISSVEDNYLREMNRVKAVDGLCCSDAAAINQMETKKNKPDSIRLNYEVNDKEVECIDKHINLKGKDTHKNSKDSSACKELLAKLKRKFFDLSPTNSCENADVSVKSTIDAAARDPQAFETPPLKPPRKFTYYATESRASVLKYTENGDRGGRRRRHSIEGALGRQYNTEDLHLRWSKSLGHYVVVVAIDFGTTYSGYAYSFLHEPDTIHLMRKQESGEPGVFNQKIPTTILLTPDGKFHSFGYAARDFYHDLDPKQAPNWMYFERFKLLLHREGHLHNESRLRTTSGIEILAMKVFAYSLSYFKDLALQDISDQSGLSFNCDVIRWVITVPAIWKASAKQFMRQAAYEAGIVAHDNPDQLLVALEPEVASIYCRRLRVFQLLSSSASGMTSDLENKDAFRTSSLSLPELNDNGTSLVSNDFVVGTRYMVVDCGGGTVDITVHELLEGGRLKELQRASGGAHGSVGVDEEFERLLGTIFGADIIQNFKQKRPSGWVDLMATFESRKRTTSPYRLSHISIAFPFSFIDFFKKCQGMSVESAVKRYNDPEIAWTTNGMLRLSPGVMRRLFLPIVDRIKQVIGNVLNNPRTPDIRYMFLVGGFAESSVIQHEMRKDFGSLLKIIIPPGTGMTILKGAVCFGLDPNIVNSRCSCHTYGVGVLHRYNQDMHPAEKKITKDGMDWCTDVLDVFVRANQSVELGESICRLYTPVRRDQRETTINIYSSENENVVYITDDGVTKCGTLTLLLNEIEANGPRREIRTEMLFGDTEIHVRAIDMSDNHGVAAKIDFINF